MEAELTADRLRPEAGAMAAGAAAGAAAGSKGACPRFRKAGRGAERRYSSREGEIVVVGEGGVVGSILGDMVKRYTLLSPSPPELAL